MIRDVVDPALVKIQELFEEFKQNDDPATLDKLIELVSSHKSPTPEFEIHAPFSSTLQCHPRELIYDFDRNMGYLKLDGRDCTDMSGCIKLFQAIDPEVRRIETWNMADEGTTYANFDGQWKAFRTGKAL